MRRKEYIFTLLMDEAIRKAYRTGTGNGEVKRLAEILRMSRWRVSRRTREIGAYEPKVKEPDWSEKEITILERNAHKNPETIRRSLLKHGYKRSIAGIILKRKRLRLPSNLEGYSACKLAECFGVDNKVITRCIERGWLKAENEDIRIHSVDTNAGTDSRGKITSTLARLIYKVFEVDPLVCGGAMKITSVVRYRKKLKKYWHIWE